MSIDQFLISALLAFLYSGERNIALRRHVVDSIHQSYALAAKDIHNLAVQVQKSHIAIQVLNACLKTKKNV